jgi:hypothetical protein
MTGARILRCAQNDSNTGATAGRPPVVCHCEERSGVAILNLPLSPCGWDWSEGDSSTENIHPRLKQ